MKWNCLLVLIALAGLPAVARDTVHELTLSTNLHRFLSSNMMEIAEADMRPYSSIIPGTNVTFRMITVRGGEYLMGSPAGEPHRKPDEGPQHRVRLEPFWMGAHEVTWNEFDVFMGRINLASRPKAVRARDPHTNALADAVALPSHPYIDQSMGMGRENYPAINMTQHAANKYCQWLSALTGHFYRLPTEAEWEYACRAGTTTKYSFGDDDRRLGEYAWFDDNAQFKYQKVGRKEPNPWGLYDMHGNVAEWTLDGYDAGTYGTVPNGALAPFRRGTKPYPHVVRGGSWNDGPALLRSASRQFSIPKWKEADPTLPRSVWHMVEADFVGFRIVRPLRLPSVEEMNRVWNNGVELE